MNTEICFNDKFEIINDVLFESLNETKRKVILNCSENVSHATIEFVFCHNQCDLSKITHVFYGREFVMSKKECHFKCQYGFMYPFSMMSFFAQENAITIIADSHKVESVELYRNHQICSLTFSFEVCGDKSIEFIICEHKPYLKNAISCYQNWYTQKFGVLPQSEKSAEDIFHVRRYFFNRELCSSHILDDKSVKLDEIYKDDCAQLGGVDAGLLFDFAYDKNTKIRCGNTKAIPFDKAQLFELKKQIDDIANKKDCKFFCYFDPYLIQDGSDADKIYKDTLPILKPDSSVCYIWDKSMWPPCVAEDKWQKFSCEFILQAAEALCCSGIYLDEFGNCSQYRCYNPKHNHKIGFSQVKAEDEYVGSLQRKITGKLWMCEFPPPDLSDNKMDIVLSDTASVINIYRFIFPKIKFIRITGCDRPLGENVWEVNKSFFNGEGLWIDNDINKPTWYSDKVKSAIREQYFVLTKYKEFFNSDTVEALIYKDKQGLWANKFSFGNRTIVTFINTSDNDLQSTLSLDGLIPVENLYSTTVIDDFNEDRFTINIKSKGVGCALFYCVSK